MPEVLGERFELVRQLGQGGFGTVYEARDRRFDDVVAVKVLRRDQPAAALSFKREFRGLADLVHPNLIRLYELVADASSMYFTMELVEGVDLLEHLCGGSTEALRTVTADLANNPPHQLLRPICTDVHVLRTALVQLASGVQALHDAGKLHCDIKPSNVMVDRTGRVVVLDFGLIAALDSDDTQRRALGTPGYCAPEQVSGQRLTAAADWYSVGVVIHQALAGRIPAPNDRCFTSSSELVDLAELCTRLLNADPKLRPTGPEVVTLLGGSKKVVAARLARLVGRDVELATLDTWWRSSKPGGTTIVRLIGASGLGKTALAEAFLQQIGNDAVILRGRCYEQESVPYKALDTVIDALAEYLRRLGADAAELVPDNARLLTRLFPALRDTVPGSDELTEGDSQEQRRRAAHILRDLLRRIGARKPIVCFLDDLQWGDVDSARLLRETLLGSAAPRMFVIASYRPEASSGGFLDAFDELVGGDAERRLVLAPLSREAGRELANALLGDRSHESAEISDEAAGNPLFIHQLAATSLEGRSPQESRAVTDLILARVRALEPSAQHLAATVALAGQPIEELVALRAANDGAAMSRPASYSLRHAHLIIARTIDGVTMIEPAHDRIREALLETMAEDAARTIHLRIAETLLELGKPDAETLVRHFHGARDQPRTRQYALIAADRADHALAFDRAAAHYKLLLELTPQGDGERIGLLEHHGDALANAGRAAEAAESYEAAATAQQDSGATAEVQLNRRRAGALTLRSGRIALGTQRMERVLEAVGVRVPRSRTSAALIALVRRARAFIRGFRPKQPTSQPSPDVLARLDALFAVATGVAMANHVLADAVHTQHLLEALDAGDPEHLIRALGQEACFQAVIGGSWLRTRYTRMLASIDELAEADDAYHRGWSKMARGVCAWFTGDWTTTWSAIEEAKVSYRECRGVTWELAMCNAYGLPALAYLGNLARLAEIVPREYANARDRGDLFAANTLRLGQQALVRLVEDRPEQAIEEADAAITPFPRESYLGPHYHHLFATVQAMLYAGRGNDAWVAIDTAWKEIKGARFLMAQCLRVEIRHLRARAALASAAMDPCSAKERHAVALADARKIARDDDVGPARPFAALIRAAVSHSRGDTNRVRADLDLAVRGFDAANMVLYAQAARFRLGGLVGGSEGNRLEHDAAEWMRAEGVVRVDRMLEMTAPGFT